MAKYRGITAQLVDSARDLRRRQTPSEVRLWNQLRRRNLDVRVRRQHPVGPFVLDFYVPEVRLAIEIDGAVHGDPFIAAQDKARSDWLLGVGIRMLRFENDDVMKRLGSVLDSIEVAIRTIRSEESA